MEIGPNTRTHPLPCLTLERQREENFSSKKDLEGLLGLHIAGFAYPDGKVNTDAKEIVQKAGFTYGCTSLHDSVRPGCDLYELTRFWQQNVGGDRFIKKYKILGGNIDRVQNE